MTRADLSPGLQAAQAAHAAFQFALENPALTRDWHDRSSYLILLSVTSEEELLSWQRSVADAGVAHSLVREPDIGNEATSLAVAPSVFGERFRHLPLQGKELAMT